MRVPCSQRRVSIAGAIPRLHLQRSLLLEARCEQLEASSGEKGQGGVCFEDIKAPGINHSKLKVCVMQSAMKCSRVAVINFPSEAAVLTRRAPGIMCLRCV